MSGASTFAPWQAMLEGSAPQCCRACVAIPARNEAGLLARCLDAFARQVDLNGEPLMQGSFEVLLLLNNCTDSSAAVARSWSQQHPSVTVHVLECVLRGEQAHAGTARKLVMDTAWARLREHHDGDGVIFSTDADTVVAPDWIAQTLQALAKGADVVGGAVEVLPAELGPLPPQVRRCYMRDRRYAELVARLEDLLDPQEGDPWPRHLDHFGSSLACTTGAYALAGGMPSVCPLEDEAFIDRVRHANLRLRHEPTVRIYTSARLLGRAEVGMAGQFRFWSELPDCRAHRVKSAAFLEHRFRSMQKLRCIFSTKHIGDLALPTDWWRETFREALARHTTCAGFLGAVYCNILIDEAFPGEREEPIGSALRNLKGRIREIERSRRAGARKQVTAREAGQLAAPCFSQVLASSAL